MANKPTRIPENKVVMAKLSREDYIKLQKHCNLKKETVNSVVKKAIMTEVDEAIPHMLAGKNLLTYNRNKDNFSWRVLLDDGMEVNIEDDLPAEYISQLLQEVKKAIDERETYIKKESKDAVAIPSKILRKKS